MCHPHHIHWIYILHRRFLTHEITGYLSFPTCLSPLPSRFFSLFLRLPLFQEPYIHQPHHTPCKYRHHWRFWSPRSTGHLSPVLDPPPHHFFFAFLKPFSPIFCLSFFQEPSMHHLQYTTYPTNTFGPIDSHSHPYPSLFFRFFLKLPFVLDTFLVIHSLVCFSFLPLLYPPSAFLVIYGLSSYICRRGSSCKYRHE